MNIKKTLTNLVIAGGIATLGLASKTLYEMHKHETTPAIEERAVINDNIRTYADLSISAMSSTLIAGILSYAVGKPNNKRRKQNFDEVMSSQNYFFN